ncbi:MAG: DNA-deoxyinosine glycosylase [Polaromonas sp.]|nr:DNA-deoxyinosine glycosylase [Burkholderiales bacterium]MDO8440621.1 DNA-deoxyinosine glycosylase [Polaromonas sp.]
MLTGLPPLVSSRTRLLILGSFPGVASLAAQQYYGHPQNHFWKILQAIWPFFPMETGADSYQIRSDWLLSRQLGVWDVYAACEREGSLDSRIRNPEVNDFAQILQQCPALEAVAHNGGESFKHAKKIAPTLATACAALPPEGAISPWGGPAAKCPELAIAVYKLPSTSPANASWSFERKLAAWREVFEKHGLT